MFPAEFTDGYFSLNESKTPLSAPALAHMFLSVFTLISDGFKPSPLEVRGQLAYFSARGGVSLSLVCGHSDSRIFTLFSPRVIVGWFNAIETSRYSP